MAGKEKYSDEVAQEWVRRYRRGDSLTAIGRDFDVGHQTVSNYLRRRGVTIRDASESNWGREWSSTQGASKSPTVRDLEWAAGFLEGEGHFRMTRTSPKATAAQANDPPLHRLVALFGGSVVNQGDGCRMWAVHGKRALGVMLTLYPLLLPAKQKQIRGVVEALLN